MNTHPIINFKANALDDTSLLEKAPSIFAKGPMPGVSKRYTFVPTARIVSGLKDAGWAPVHVQEQRSRKESRLGFQKHLIRFRRVEQMEYLDEWNVELVVVNSHDAGCTYQLHTGVFRRICSNGLVMSERSFPAIRLRHAGLDSDLVVQSSLSLLQAMPKVGELVASFKAKVLREREAINFAAHALKLRYGSLAEAPIEAKTLLNRRRAEDAGLDLWSTTNTVQENLIRGGGSDCRYDKRGRLRVVRAIRGIDSKVALNKGLWDLAEKVNHGETLPPIESHAFSE